MNTATSPTMTAVDAMSVQGHGLGSRNKPRSLRDSGETARVNEETKRRAGAETDNAPKSQGVEDMPDEDSSPFEFKPTQLASLVDPKNVGLLTDMGGVKGLIKGLGTHSHHGLSKQALGQCVDSKADHGGDGGNGNGDGAARPGEDSPSLRHHQATVEDRKRVYGQNILPARRSKSLLLLMWLAFKDKVLVRVRPRACQMTTQKHIQVLLSIAAVVSLALGLFQDFGTPPQTVQCGTERCNLPQVDWVEGVAIMVAVIIVVVVGSLNDWQKERQFRALNEKKEDRGVKVIRHGDEMVINIKVRPPLF